MDRKIISDLTLFLILFFLSTELIISSVIAETKLNKNVKDFFDIFYSIKVQIYNITDIAQQYKYRKKQY